MPISSPNISPPPCKRRRISQPSPVQTPAVASPPSPPNIFCDPSKSAVAVPLRIFSWNINGIQPFLPPSTPKITNFLAPASGPKAISAPPSLRAKLHSGKWPHIFFLQEVKMAASDTKTPTVIRRAINVPLDEENAEVARARRYNAHFCLPRDKHNATGFEGKIYGVCALLRQDLAPVTTVRVVDWDLEGRVQLLEISSMGLVVVNVYAVNGTTYDYRDPQTGKVIGSRHDRKRNFHTLLAKEVKAYEEKGWGVIVAGDINISRSKIDSFPQLRMGKEHVTNRADFEEKFINELGMLDTFRLMHGEKRKYSYRPTNKPWGAGGDRVDMILVTKGLKGWVKEADILDSEEERGPSDHVPLMIKLEAKEIEEEGSVPGLDTNYSNVHD